MLLFTLYIFWRSTQKVRDRHDAEPLRSGTLEELVAAENLDKKTTATQGLVWLLRGLEFTYKALLRSLRNPTEELSESFSKAYEDSLKKFHSFVVKPIFNVSPAYVIMSHQNSQPSACDESLSI